MSTVHIVFCCLTIYSVSEGNIIQGTIGQNISFSWTFNILRNDDVYILHNGSRIHRFFPNYQRFIASEPPHRVRVTVDYPTTENVTVTVNILNIIRNDAGTYRVVRKWNLEDLAGSVNLQTTEMNHYRSMTPIWKGDTEDTNSATKGINNDTTTALSQKFDTEGINHNTTATMTPEVDVEAFPSKRHLLYIVLGMGTLLAAAFLACLLHKIRICLRVNRLSNRNKSTDSNKDDRGEHLHEKHLLGNYWTIVSDEEGEVSTAIEMDFEQHSEPQLIAQSITPRDNESDENSSPEEIALNEEFDGYINPVHSSPIEFDESIHRVHLGPVNTINTSIQLIRIL